MTFDLSNPVTNAFYVNFRSVAPPPIASAEIDPSARKEVFAVAEQNFNFSNLLEDASKYLVSVERFRVPVHTIPMYPEEINTVLLTGGPPTLAFSASDSYSLLNFVEQFNESDVESAIRLTITNDGRLRLLVIGAQGYDTLQFSPRFAAVVGMPISISNPTNTNITGSAPVFDRFDQLAKINLVARTGLSNIQQEVVTTNIFKNVLTDFLVPSTSSISFTAHQNGAPDPDFTVSDTVRQDIEFNSASDRRLINMRGNAPIQNVKIEVEAVMRDGTTQRILLPPNGILEVKLAFWRREA